MNQAPENPYRTPHAKLDQEPTYTAAGLNPWLAIWVQPRRTVAQLLKHPKASETAMLLAMYGGILNAFTNAANSDIGSRYSLQLIIGGALVLGPLIGALSWFIGSRIIAETSRWLGGRGNFTGIRIPLGWYQVIMLPMLPIWITLLVVVGADFFQENALHNPAPGVTSLYLLFAVAQVMLSIWSIVVLCNGISEVEGISAWRAFFATVIAALLAVVAIFALIFVLMLVFGIFSLGTT